MANQPYEASQSVFETNGIDDEVFAVVFDGAYCNTFKNIKKITDDFSISFCIFDMDFSGGQNGIFYMKGIPSLLIYFKDEKTITVNGKDFIVNETNNWTHFVIQRKNNFLELFQDGIKNPSTFELSGELGGGNISIGYTNSDRYLRAKLYDFRYYPDKSLSENAVKYLWNDYTKYKGERTMPQVKYGKSNKQSE